MQDKYHDLDRLISAEVRRELLDAGITEYEAKCRDCNGTGRDVMSDSVNWLPCFSCEGKGSFRVAV